MNTESSPTFRHDRASPMSAQPAPWLLSTLRGLRLPTVLAALAIVALGLAFHNVVSGAVEQGQSRRLMQTTHADATWRCNAQRDRQLRADCTARLNLAAGSRQALQHDIDLATADLPARP